MGPSLTMYTSSVVAHFIVTVVFNLYDQYFGFHISNKAYASLFFILYAFGFHMNIVGGSFLVISMALFFLFSITFHNDAAM